LFLVYAPFSALAEREVCGVNKRKRADVESEEKFSFLKGEKGANEPKNPLKIGY